MASKSNLTGWAAKLRARGLMARIAENRREDQLRYWSLMTPEEKARRIAPMLAALRKIRPLISGEERRRRKQLYNKAYYLRQGAKVGGIKHPWKESETARIEEIIARRGAAASQAVAGARRGSG